MALHSPGLHPAADFTCIDLCAGAHGLGLGVGLAVPIAFPGFRARSVIDIEVHMTGAERQRRYRERHPERARATCRAYHSFNAPEIRVQKAEYYQRVRKAKDATEEGRLKERDKKARRRTLTKSGSVSAEEWAAIVTAHDGKCSYCGRSDRPLEQDHVLALSRGGRHAADNIVPACKPCNSRKGAK